MAKKYTSMAVTKYSHAEFYSRMLDLELLHIASGRFEYQAVNTFPFNVFYAALTPDPESILENLTGNEWIPAEKDLVMIVPRNLKIRRDVHVKNAFFTVHFNASLISGFDLFDNCPQCFRRRDPDMIRKIHSILAEKDPVRTACRIRAMILEFCADYIPAVDQRLLASSERYHDMLMHLRETVTARTTVMELAAKWGMRPDVFARSFHRDIGYSPSGLLKQFLTQRISRHLLEGDAPLKVIAEDLGFCSEYHLSAYFKRQIGMAPGQYRKHFLNKTK